MEPQEGLYGSSSPQNLLRNLPAEVIGTYVLTLPGIILVVALQQQPSLAGNPLGNLAIAVVFGLALMVAIGFVGLYSGAHLNPAVTLGVALYGKHPWRLVPPYWLAQFVGAWLAAMTLKQGRPAAFGNGSLGAPNLMPGVSDRWGLFVEGLITAILVGGVIATTDKRAKKAAASLNVGGALALAVFIGSFSTGGGANPARSLSPMFAAGKYLPHGKLSASLGPLLGAIAISLVMRFLACGSQPAAADATADSSAEAWHPSWARPDN
jgi:MIP family channel proteins